MKECIRVIDIGGNGLRRADIYGTKVRNLEQRVPIALRNTKKAIESLLEFSLTDLPSATEGVAYSVAGVIKNNSLIQESPNVHFLDMVDLADLTKSKVGIESAIFNDMEAAVTGIAALLPKEHYFMGITWSSGIGLRIWKNGNILSGAEGGHMVLDPSPFAPLCGCGKRGHVEAIIGGDAIKRRIIAEIQTLDINLPKDKHPCQFLNEAYVKGKQKEKEWAENFFGVIGRCMGIFLANIQTLLYLPLIVWKGTFAIKTLSNLEPYIRETMRNCLIDPDLAQESNLRFEFTPGPNNKDSLIGAARSFNIFKM
jgi:predicted NBD/HSP70 family sugar kinase